jgi:hypothetical protein
VQNCASIAIIAEPAVRNAMAALFARRSLVRQGAEDGNTQKFDRRVRF